VQALLAKAMLVAILILHIRMHREEVAVLVQWVQQV
jgi:hypothetical protein